MGLSKTKTFSLHAVSAWIPGFWLHAFPACCPGRGGHVGALCFNTECRRAIQSFWDGLSAVRMQGAWLSGAGRPAGLLDAIAAAGKFFRAGRRVHVVRTPLMHTCNVVCACLHRTRRLSGSLFCVAACVCRMRAALERVLTAGLVWTAGGRPAIIIDRTT